MTVIAPAELVEWKPFWGKSTTPLQHDIICLHTMVGTLAGSWNYARQSGQAYWHFGLAGDGTCWQCQGLEYRSAANLYGNWHVIPIETADSYEGIWGAPPSCGSVPRWTDAQVDKLVKLIAWLCARYDIPPVLIPDTQVGRRGIAYHRQGIDPHRHWNGEKWSNSTGKCCPDHARIDQLITIIIPRVQRILDSATTTSTGGGFLSDLTAKEQRRMYERTVPNGSWLHEALLRSRRAEAYAKAALAAAQRLDPHEGMTLVAALRDELKPGAPMYEAIKQIVKENS